MMDVDQEEDSTYAMGELIKALKKAKDDEEYDQYLYNLLQDGPSPSNRNARGEESSAASSSNPFNPQGETCVPSTSNPSNAQGEAASAPFSLNASNAQGETAAGSSTENPLKRRYLDVRDRRMPWCWFNENLTHRQKVRIFSEYMKQMSINEYKRARTLPNFAEWPEPIQIPIVKGPQNQQDGDPDVSSSLQK